MVRNSFADESLLKYISNVSKQDKFNIGLLLGQHASGKDYIIHFAKTPALQGAEGDQNPVQLSSISDINENWISDHAKHATRMLPGGMHVLGLFITSQENLLNPFNAKLKSLILQIHKQLESIKYLHASGSPDKLVLNYVTSTQNYMCKSFDVITSNVSTVDFKFVSKPAKWCQVECKYNMDQLYFIKQNYSSLPLKKHMNVVLDKIAESLGTALFLFDEEYRDDEDSIESIGKKKKLSKLHKSNQTPEEDSSKVISLSIFETGTNKNVDADFEVMESGGEIRLLGQVTCNLWFQPVVTIGSVNKAVIEDIMRSLTTRLTMQWDSLVEEDHSEDAFSIHEPPRRVFVNLPLQNILVSDYLFPGEGSEDAYASLEEMLDIKMNEKMSVLEAEKQADTSVYYDNKMDSDIISKLPTGSNNIFYFVGLGVALFVLLLSLLIHFFRN